ncbi:CoA activase [Myxococcota bacterium]|nr:CoA activase [Myxococcota bacterium]MBU1431313.1 CoA activase [Myxococcota bacterium]MBU1898923.1 CoA activase [Myxococcota bacterium]
MPSVIGIDLGAETIKLVRLTPSNEPERGGLVWVERRLLAHHKDPEGALRRLLSELDWSDIEYAAATGRAARLLGLQRVPTKAALAEGVRQQHPELGPCTVISIGSHGFSLLEIRDSGPEIYRENARCSQGTGNFLQQLVERFGLSVEAASEVCAAVTDPAPLSGRCPVILKTDMTHLANKGESQPRILAGLYDAVCENVQVLVKPGSSPAATLLIGGVAVADRIRDHFRRFLSDKGMRLIEADPQEGRFIEALGAARLAYKGRHAPPPVEGLFVPQETAQFEFLPALTQASSQIRRMPREILPVDPPSEDVVLGFDMGSTGSKAVALSTRSRAPLWEGYLNTQGNPVAAAQRLTARFLEETNKRHRVMAVGATGSGREIVGSLMSICYGPQRVFVLNEIAAHAEGALFFDPEVDTIFEIGGQDAKYIRLQGGRISDAAMNEACSAGTGSFIAEQGQKFQGIRDVIHMNDVALEAGRGVSLGQHCSVFMAEIIDEAVSSGVEQPAIVAGIYDAIIQNYLNRVKGNRSVGQRIFCQGMPFASDALAAAVVRQTGAQVIIPPNPGTIGALGIGLLAARKLDVTLSTPIDLGEFLTAEVKRKDSFVCKSTQGCGAPGNLCKIDRLRVEVSGETRKFIWGGNCALYDAGTQSHKLPDRAPDPFRERAQLLNEILDPLRGDRQRPLVAMTDEFTLKGMAPFFATFIYELGFDLHVLQEAGQRTLKRGIEVANVPYCAPLQMFHGVAAELAALKPHYLLLPMLRELPRSGDERISTTCPMVQASPDLIAPQLNLSPRTKILAPRIDMGMGDMASARFGESCRALAESLGVKLGWEIAYLKAMQAQEGFQRRCLEIGDRALAFAQAQGLVTVVVLGRSYTIYNTVLNSNVPNILREQGTIAIPVDCYRVHDNAPLYHDVYWGYSQVNLRAAHQIRRSPGVYALFTSNYSCGPDSFNLHFFSYIMQGKPFAIIETDGHSGDAGTKTRVEAFLYCVEEDLNLSPQARAALPLTQFTAIEEDKVGIFETIERGEVIEIPPMGVGSPVLAAILRADGMRAEVLPLPDRETLRLGRKYTSGKECVPITITLGSMLQRLYDERDSDERFAFFMPTADGPCRFGVYNLLHKIVFEHLGMKDRVTVVSPPDSDYFAGLPADLEMRIWLGFVAADLLLMALHDVRPVERVKGGAQAIFDRHYQSLVELLEGLEGGSMVRALAEIPGEAFGVRALLQRAAVEFAEMKDFSQRLPTVSFVGEIYCRLDPFANDFIIDKLEARGIKVAMAPFNEWLEYTNHLQKVRVEKRRMMEGDNPISIHLTGAIQAGVMDRFYKLFADKLDWHERTRVKQAIQAAAPYLSDDLIGEAVLTLGGPIHEFEHGQIHGVVSVGPHECMPAKIAEAQYCHVSEEKGLVVLNVPLNGDPLDVEMIDNFAFEVRQYYEERRVQDKVRKKTRRIAAVEPTSEPRFKRWLGEVAPEATMKSLKVLRPMSKKLATPLAAIKSGVGLAPERTPAPRGDRPGEGPGEVGLRWPPSQKGDLPRS